MKRAGAVLSIFVLAGFCGCGNGPNDPDNTDVLAYMGISVGKVWNYDVQVAAAVLTGRLEVEVIDTEFVDGVEAYRLTWRQNNIPVLTRWLDVRAEGLFLLGENAKEGPIAVDRTFSNPIKLIPYPLEDERGIPVQSWSTESELVEGGSEQHRFDNAGKASHTVPAGTFEAFHLVHTRTDKDAGNHQYDEYFVPNTGFVQFDYPEDEVWSLLP